MAINRVSIDVSAPSRFGRGRILASADRALQAPFSGAGTPPAERSARQGDEESFEASQTTIPGKPQRVKTIRRMRQPEGF
jgi:hypothetical protein